MTFVLVPLNDLLTSRKIRPFSKHPHQPSQALEGSIKTVGLLNPLIVTKQKSKYLVLDGKKRLVAIQHLNKSQGGKARTHRKIPCIVDWPAANPSNRKLRPALMRSPELAHAIISDFRAGESKAAIAQKYDCSTADVSEALSFQTLHPEVSMHFNNETIDWEQAAALATIENPNAQLSLLLQLGPFVSDKEIVAAIRQGETVIDLPDGNTLCLPSRKLPEKTTSQQKEFDSPSHTNASFERRVA